MLLRQSGGGGSGVSLLRDDEQLVGAVNGINKTYTLPNGDKAVVADPGAKIKVYVAGVRLHEGLENDFTVSESGGAGTGFNVITLLHFAPVSGDNVIADYIKAP